MELKDKIIEDRDAAHAESQEREALKEHEEKLPAPIVEAIHEADRQRRSQLLGTIRMILGRQRVEIGQLRMPPRETRALQALQAAVEGKSNDLQQFVYASDRRDLLERALGVLQPDLTRTDDKTSRELHAQLKDLSERLGQLRHRLSSLEDAQDELLRGQEDGLEVATAPGDKPKPSPRPSDPDAPRPTTTLTGPELPAPAPAKTTLTGPELPEPAPARTTLVGPELPEQRPLPTTLVGPELPAPPPAKTTLTGPDLPEVQPPASTLGGDGPGGAAAPGDGPGGAAAPGDAPGTDDGKKRPWWRRPFG